MKVSFEDIGLIPYQQAWDYQEMLLDKIVKQKLKNEKLPEDEQKVTDNWLLFCEHPHVYTLGKSGSEENLLADALQMQAKKVEFIHTNRGGDITYHGPGQIVGYPVLNLIYFASGIRQYIEKLEESIILTLNEFGLSGERLDGATGVWLDTKTPGKIRKICAIGVRTSHWITMHGFAFNVNTDLSYFSMINPCGFTDKSVTSLEKELGGKQDMEKVKMLLKEKIADVFGMEFE
ncbi:MAG: lipoyl(octanoyl) transferase LipB [Bacteroidales bacterium]